ncbi:hypothetical protein [Cellulomonas palmilytica]|uniref:hypothetical protein n=1 Tax=Cellulomonas palmilytica TaxID=2608402 RepID=UPI001F35A432|nr:hypothetical protein [Cellulomonas palmilytica]UJP39368.1 hypothetical protein F1D97_13635 [Cellulomonas palmilytica]
MTDSTYPGIPIASNAPDTMLAAVDIVRSIIQPVTGDREAEAREHDNDVWTIYGDQFRVTPDRLAFRLFGDLSIFDNGWFVGVTVAVMVDMRGNDRPATLPDGTWSPATENALTERLGAWASHVMWDVASSCARRLAAQSYASSPHVPITTPEAVLLLSEEE